MLALMMREEPTLRAAMESSVRYMQLRHNAGVQLRLEDAGDLVLLHVDIKLKHPGLLPPGGRNVNRHPIVRSYQGAVSHDAFKPVGPSASVMTCPPGWTSIAECSERAIDFVQEFNAVCLPSPRRGLADCRGFTPYSSIAK